MKKALIIATVSGFVPQFEMNNVKILQELGYEVHYASNFCNPHYGFDNHRLDGTGIIRHQVNFARSPFKFKENKKAYRQLKELMGKYRFELVHCHTPVGAALARLAARPYRNSARRLFPVAKELYRNCKVIYTAHGFHFYKGAPLRYWLLFYPVEWWLAGYTDILITINEEDYARAKRFCRRKHVRVEHIPGVGVDTAYFAGHGLPSGGREEIRKRVRRELQVLEGETVFLSVGELSPRKNHTVAIQAFAELKKEILKPFHYFICGQGTLREKLQRQIDMSGISGNATLLGYKEDIRDLLYAADMFVFPSLQEGMPVALIEALAAGLPVIASDIRGNRELVRGREDAVCFRGKESLKQALEKVLDKAPGIDRTHETDGVLQPKTDYINSVAQDFAQFSLGQVDRQMRKVYQGG